MPALTKALLGREEVALRWRLALAEYTRDARVAAGLTQSDLAELASTPDRVNIRRGPRQPHDS